MKCKAKRRLRVFFFLPLTSYIATLTTPYGLINHYEPKPNVTKKKRRYEMSANDVISSKNLHKKQ